MRYSALATDYDGTIATNGKVSQSLIDALETFSRSGRKLILVTGRELPDLRRVLPNFHIFDLIVGENGAVLFEPSSNSLKILSARPPASLIDSLRERGVNPLSVGEVILATVESYASVCADVIRQQGLQMQFILNKGSLMILPHGVDKQSGLEAAVAHLKLSADQVVGVGDAENDCAFLKSCGLSVAVANAVLEVKKQADLCTAGAAGDGVEELIRKLLAS